MLCATLKNQKWVATHQQTGQVRGQVTEQVAGQVTNSTVQDDKVAVILDFCSIPRSRKEIQSYLGLTGRNNFNDKYLKPLLASYWLRSTPSAYLSEDTYVEQNMSDETTRDEYFLQADSAGNIRAAHYDDTAAVRMIFTVK